MLLQVGADAEFVFQDHFAEVFDAALHIFDPARGSLEFVAGSDVEAQVAVEDGHDVVWRHVFG